MASSAHWESIYASRDPTLLSWYQSRPVVSLELIRLLDIPRDAAVIDVGGGASSLVDELSAAGYTDLTVLDIAATALQAARSRAGEAAASWLCADLLTWSPDRSYDLWHDRAVLHFLVDAADRRRYVATLRAALYDGGNAIIATFAPGAPDHCSGLPVQRYDAGALQELLGSDFELVDTRDEVHHTPAGVAQPFTWVAARCAPQRAASGT